MEKTSLVSVLIPFFNQEKFLSEAVESVLAQTYDQWELFLVDDGSNDGSTAIARDFAKRWPEKICYLEHPGHVNRGVACTRNLGAKHSRGDYFALLDSDDVWLPQKLELQVALMDAHPEAGLLYGPSEYWYDWNGTESKIEKNSIQAVAPGGRLYHPTMLLRISHPFGPCGAPCPSSFLIRRRAFESVGGFVESFNPETYQLYEDTAFLTKIYINVPVFVSQKCTDRYRCHSDSIWHRTKGTGREEHERRYYLRWLGEYIKEHPITEQFTRKAIRRETWMYSFPSPPFVTKLLRRIVRRIAL